MAQIETWLSQDMLEAVKVQYLDGNIFSQDNAGNLIGVLLNRGDVPYAGGGSVSANVIRADGSTVAVVGALSGNAATVVLPQSAYAVPGVVSIVVKLTVSGEVTTIAAVVANVYQSSTDSAIDPGTIIPSVQNLISAIETAVASIPADYSSLWTSLAPAFSTSTNYTVCQYVTYNGALYRFTVDHPAGAWNSAHVTATNIGSDLNSLKSALNAVGDSVYEKDTTTETATAVSGQYTNIDYDFKKGTLYKITFTQSIASTAYDIASWNGNSYIDDPIVTMPQNALTISFDYIPSNFATSLRIKKTRNDSCIYTAVITECENKYDEIIDEIQADVDFTQAQVFNIETFNDSGTFGNTYAEIDYYFSKDETYNIHLEMSKINTVNIDVATKNGSAYVQDPIATFIAGKTVLDFYFTPSADATKLIIKRVSSVGDVTYTATIKKLTNKISILGDDVKIIESEIRNAEIITETVTSVAGEFTNIPVAFEPGYRFLINIVLSRKVNQSIAVGSYTGNQYIENPIATIPSSVEQFIFAFDPKYIASNLRIQYNSGSDTVTYTVSIQKYKIERNIISIANAPEILPDRTGLGMMKNVLNSHEIGKAISSPMVTFKQPTDKLANGLNKLCVNGNTMYVCETTHDGETIDENIHYHNYIRLFKINMETWEIEAQTIVAEKGGSYLFSDGNTYTYPNASDIVSPYSGVCVYADGYIHLTHSAPINNDTCVVHNKIDPSTLSVLQRDICHCSGDVDYCKINGIKSTEMGLGWTGYIKKGDYYYATQIYNNKQAVVLRTGDFINFEPFYLLEEMNLVALYGELGIGFDTYLSNEYMYLCARSAYSNESYLSDAYNYVYKIRLSDKRIIEVAKIKDCHTQPTFFWTSADLYLHCAYGGSRYGYGFVKIDRESLCESIIVADIDYSALNANTSFYVDSSDNIYMTMTAGYVSKIRLDYYGDYNTQSFIQSLIELV